MNRIVLAYSGSLATSVAIRWLADKYRAEVVTVTLDLGQGSELEDVRARAIGIGAARAHVLDVREEFAQSFVLPALQAGAGGEGSGPIVGALSTPLIARRVFEIARIESATAIAHGCLAGSDDQTRFESSVRTLDSSLRILAPSSLWDLSPREQVDYAKTRGIPASPAASDALRVTRNLWGRTVECGALDDPSVEPAEAVFELTRPPLDAPDTPAYVEIEFASGVPVATNGVALSLVELVQSLETIAGAHGVGRIDRVGNGRGARSRTVHEVPAALALHRAHRELQTFVTPPELARVTADLSAAYADLIDAGLWFSPTREAIDALVAKVQESVTGTIRLKLFKGDCHVVGRQSASAPTGQAGPARDRRVGGGRPKPAPAGARTGH
jgi:argininosuccinate synthase